MLQAQPRLGLSFFDPSGSDYAIEDDGADLVAAGIAELDKPGITSITLVDAGNADRADADQGVALTEISGTLTSATVTVRA